MALVVKRTAAAGGADAVQTSAQGIWNQIDAMLLAAGWTVLADYSTGVGGWTINTIYGTNARVLSNGNIYQANSGGTSAGAGIGPGVSGQSQSINDGSVNWRYVMTSGANAKVYTSTGESGNEAIFLRVDWTTTFVNFLYFQYADSAGNCFNVAHTQTGGFGGPAFGQHSYTAATNVNYVMLADKDSFMGVTGDTLNARRFWGGGIMKRLATTNPNIFISNGTVTAGSNRTFTFASGDPIAAGYVVGDDIMVVSQQSGTIANGVIPVYSARIVALTTNSITIDEAKQDTLAGARIGADPNPTFGVLNSVNQDLAGVAVFYSHNVIDNTFTNQYQSFSNPLGFAPGIPETGIRLTAPLANNRTGLVWMTDGIVRSTSVNSTGQIRGIIPKLYFSTRVTDALWSIGRTVRDPSPRDFVTFPTTFPATGSRNALGPIPVSGSANYSAFVSTTDTTELKVEVTLKTEEDSRSSGFVGMQDRTSPRGYGNGLGYDTFQAEVVVVENPSDMMVEVVHPGPPTGDDIYVGQQDRPSPDTRGTTVEPVPLDSPVATQGGGSSGFNSGLN